MAVLDHVLVPVASEDDARATCGSLRPYQEEIERVTAVHVVEKAGGAVDKAPVAKRRSDASDFLAVVDAKLGDALPVDTETAFGTDVVATIFAVATDTGATAVAFRPRGGSRIVRLLAGDTASRLVTDPEIPVVALPEPRND